MTRLQNRLRAAASLPWAFFALSLMGLLVLWACHLGPEDGKDTFDLDGDPAWTNCHSVVVALLDENGDLVSVLFEDSLKSIDQLKNLDASEYQGGKGAIQIKGYHADSSVCFDQTRSFDEGGTKVRVDTILDPNVAPKTISVEPKDLALTMGSPAANLTARITPEYADGAVQWTVESNGVVALEGLDGGKGNPARIKPLKAGISSVKVRSLKDTSLTFTVPVRVTDPGSGSIDIGKDTVLLYVQGAAESLTVKIPDEYKGQTVEWKTGNIDVAVVDNRGNIKPGKEGETKVQAILRPSGLSDEALVRVVQDKPKLTVNAPKGAPVGSEILFEAVATQKFGDIVVFKHDLDGDGTFDSVTTPGGWKGDSVNLPAVKAKYDKEGQVTARFQVRDSEGNLGEASVLLDIGNQAPDILSVRADTVISVKDSISMFASAKDGDGKVAWLGWDYEGDGQFDDTLVVDAAEAKLERGHRFHEAATYKAVFRAKDNNGKASQAIVTVKVEFDQPKADAGPDQTVLAGAAFTIPVKGTDKFGGIVKREIKLGANDFVTLPEGKDEVSQQAPDKAASLRAIIRVTDDDGLTALDTVDITVILSSNADLTDLAFSAGPLSPTFTPNAKTYQARVAFADSLVKVTPKVKDGSTKISVNGDEVESGKPSREVKLALGRNVDAFLIVTTAADGTQREYSVTVTRDPNGEATLGKLEVPGFTLSPAFAPATLDYSDTVTHAVSSVTFKPTVASAGATLTFNDSGITSGTFTQPQPLKFGENTFKFVVTAMDGKSTSAYTVRILRLGHLVVLRKLGGGAAAVVDSFDIPVESARPVSGGGVTGWKFAKWSVVEGEASFADSAANPTELTLKSGLAKVQASFDMLRFTIKASSSGCGKMDPGTVTLDYGVDQTYKMEAAAGCRIQSALVDGKEDTAAYDGSYTFSKLTADHTFEVKFVRTYTLSVKVSGKGTVTPPTATVDSGTKVTFTAKPESGNKVAKNGVCEDEKTCYDPDKEGHFGVEAAVANKSYTVAFVPALRMRGSFSGGTGTITPVDTVVDNLSNVTWQWTFPLTHRLDGVMLDGVEAKPTTVNSLVLNGVTADHAVQIVLKRRYAVTYDVGPGGTLAPTQAFVDSAGRPTFTATPATGYRVDTVEVNGTAAVTTGLGKWSPQTWQLDPAAGPTTIKVRFKRYYNITTKPGGGGDITPQNVNIDSGATQTWTVSLSTGYYVTAIDMNGSNPRSLLPNLSGGTLTLANVAEEGTITAAFSNLYTIRATSNLAKTGPFPILCIEWAAGQFCNEKGGGVVTQQIPYGTQFAVSASANALGGRGEPAYNFHYWEYSKLPTCDLSIKETVSGNMTFPAFYSTALPPKECQLPF